MTEDFSGFTYSNNKLELLGLGQADAAEEVETSQRRPHHADSQNAASSENPPPEFKRKCYRIIMGLIPKT